MTIEESNIGKVFLRRSDKALYRIVDTVNITKGSDDKPIVVPSYYMQEHGTQAPWLPRTIYVPTVSLAALFELPK